jgi:hypothetical protein
VLPQNAESWFFLIAACVLGFVLGQWLHRRRNKPTKEQEALALLAGVEKKKRLSKKERLKSRRRSN